MGVHRKLGEQAPLVPDVPTMGSRFPQVAQALALQRILGNRATRSWLVADRTRSPAIVQRKEVSELKGGGFNMIGETHSDYSSKDARRYEAKVVREAVGEGAQYYTEHMLKVAPTDLDHADPTGLRLEQVIAFITSRSNVLVPKLRAIDSGAVAGAVVRDDAATAAAKKVAWDLSPVVASAKYSLDAILGRVKGLDLSVEVVGKLAEIENWDCGTFDKDSAFEENYEAVTDQMFDLMFEMEDALGGPAGLTPQQQLKLLADDVNTLFADFGGRLPTTLKEYLHLREVSPFYSGFDFKRGDIQVALAAWNDVKPVHELVRDALGAENFKVVAGALDIYGDRLTKLVKVLEAGSVGRSARSVKDVRVARSVAMHEAAERLRGTPIVWKVGNLHVEDIKQLEKDAKIAPTDYAYITKDAFKAKYINEQMLHGYKGTDDDLGRGFVEGAAEDKRVQDVADQILQTGAIPAANPFVGLVHLDLRSLITNQTGVIVEAVEKGFLPKLKTLTIPALSMTPSLRGRLIASGVKVILT